MPEKATSLAARPLILLLRLYRFVISPMIHALPGAAGGGCRFTPTCSEYAIQAIQIHGALRGTQLALPRLGRCHPFSPGGFDPVPHEISRQQLP